MESHNQLNQPEDLRTKIDQWEFELYELSGRAQNEVVQAGQIVRDKYDDRIIDLRNKVEEAKRKLKDKKDE
jgi:hypothetical protein